MKREELAGLGLTSEAVDKVMALHGRDVEKHKAAVQALEEQRTADTAALQKQLAQRERAEAAERVAASLHFSSKSARSAFLVAFDAAQQSGQAADADAFTAAYRADDPDAFAPAQDAAGKTPVLVRSTGGGADFAAPDAALRRAFGLPGM